MFDFSTFYQIIAKNRLSSWLNVLPAQLAEWNTLPHGDMNKWLKAVRKMPTDLPVEIDIKDSVTIKASEPLEPGMESKIASLLKFLCPWRKGPYFIHGTHIDTEWRSDWKWDRVLPHISPLKDRYVLDVGCGSGYHMWRMLGEGAKFVVGIDPVPLFLCQFHAVKTLMGGNDNIHFIPSGIEKLPELKAFDTVFSMGVLYHRKSPLDHLTQLKSQLRKGGELVLETLVVDGDENTVLVPVGRYAQMRNVYFFPSSAALKVWLENVGFEDVRIVDEGYTTVEEQRSTEWMTNESLSDFLDPNDPTKTAEGYPAPKRAVLIAVNPD